MNETENKLYEHILGGLYGQALGDAFCMPAYFRPAETWARYGGWVEDFHPGPAEHPIHSGLQAGQITDDTEQAFALAEVIIEEGEVTVEGAARALVKWYDDVDGDNNPCVGPSSRRAVDALKSGADPRRTGRQGDTDGGAMKISPVGLINPGGTEQAVRDAFSACIPSHATDVGVSGAAAVAASVAKALVPGSSLDSIIAAGRKGAVEGEALGESWFGTSVYKKLDLALEIVAETSSEFDRICKLYDLIGSTLATADSAPSAFGILQLGQGDPMTCAKYAMALSGDADTVGAMCCAIAGAWKGAGCFPVAVVKKLETVNSRYDFRGVARGLTRIALSRM